MWAMMFNFIWLGWDPLSATLATVQMWGDVQAAQIGWSNPVE